MDFVYSEGQEQVEKAKYRRSTPYLAGLITLWEC